jgi:hypothetical protein
MNYVIFKTGDDWQGLLDKVFQDKVKIDNKFFFFKHWRLTDEEGLGWYNFYATRYDYLRIAKAMMDDWNNDTCVGKYLKAMYDQRINKHLRDKPTSWATNNNAIHTWYTKSYGGQFHFDLLGLTNRKILTMTGAAGQNIHIDFDAKRIIVINASDNHVNWRGHAYKHLKK